MSPYIVIRSLSHPESTRQIAAITSPTLFLFFANREIRHTQLMLAAYHGHADLVKLLIDHGADPNRLNDRGQSPLAGAVFKKEDTVIEVSLVSIHLVDWTYC